MVAQGGSGEIYIFIIPVAEELDFKKSSKGSRGEKKGRNDSCEGYNEVYGIY